MTASSDPVILLTGATGMVGQELVKRLLLLQSGNIVVLIRSMKAVSAAARFERLKQFLAKTGIPVEHLRKLQLLAGDLAVPHFNVRESELLHLAKSVTHIMHCAADTRFSLSLEKARAANVYPTRELIKFALACPKLEVFGFASTVYVAGKRSGRVLEDDLVNVGFVNAYEQSKFEAEELLRSYFGKLPVAVYRLSTIIGSAKDGSVSKTGAIHAALRLYFAGLIPMIPGRAGDSAELLDIEYAADAITHLFMQSFEPNRTYHIVSGSRASYTFGEFLAETHRIFSETSPPWRNKGIEVPPLIPPQAYDLAVSMAEAANDASLHLMLEGMRYFAPQLSYPKEFDTARRDGALPAVMQPPHITTYYQKILEWCIATNWGRVSKERI